MATEISARMIRALTGAALLLVSVGSCNGEPAVIDCHQGCAKPTADDQRFIAEFCDDLVSCCQQHSTAGGAQPKADVCRRRFGMAGPSNDQSLRTACLQDLKQLKGGSTCFFDLSDFSHPCYRVLSERSGPQTPGGSCISDGDCQGQVGHMTYCSYNPSDTVGSCLQVARGKLGDQPCLGDMKNGVVFADSRFENRTGKEAWSGVYCSADDGLICRETSDSWRCESLLRSGASCRFPDECVSNRCLDADNFAGRPAPVCDALAAVGQSCANASCGWLNACQNGLCAPKLGPGAVCVDNSQCATDGCDDGHCSTESGPFGFLCALTES